MKKSIVAVVLTFLLCFSCGPKDNDERYMEIDNLDLKRELAFYVDSLDSVHKGVDYVIRVYCRDVNDTLKRYTIFDEIDYNLWKKCSYNYKSRVNGKDILFVMWTVDPNQSLNLLPVFKLDDESFVKDAERCFPKIYKKYGLKDYRYPEIIYEPELIHLTFSKDKLIGK